MQATGTPNPFPVARGFRVVVSGGKPPYTFTPAASPPNPPGVQVDADGRVTVPIETPSGTNVQIHVTDSANPTHEADASSQVA
jgi:hypothetical protein